MVFGFSDIFFQTKIRSFYRCVQKKSRMSLLENKHFFKTLDGNKIIFISTIVSKIVTLGVKQHEVFVIL